MKNAPNLKKVRKKGRKGKKGDNLNYYCLYTNNSPKLTLRIYEITIILLRDLQSDHNK